jgi:hypothetical protein
MAKEEKKEKVASKIRLRVYEEKSTIYRNDGMPSIDDKTDEAVKWLAAKGYKESDIEIIGEKPAIWATVYPPVAA